jgi:hypothetical protein
MQQTTHAEEEFATELARAPLPGDRHALLDWAEHERPPSWVVLELAWLPAGTTYRDVGEIWRSLGHDVEVPGT